MAFQPSVGQALAVDGVAYQVAADPDRAGAPLAIQGDRATVYRLETASGLGAPAAGAARALKLYETGDEPSGLLGHAVAIGPLTEIAGLTAARRTIIEPTRNWMVLRRYPDLMQAIVMPWIGGGTWRDVLVARQALTAAECGALARRLLGVLVALEHRGAAHGELAASNLLLVPDVAGLRPELVDLESVYLPELPRPEILPINEPAYTHLSGLHGLWQAEMDRFAGAILLTEILSWHDPEVRAAAWAESLFDPRELGQNSDRYRLVRASLSGAWGERVAWLFERAWLSSQVRECAPLADWNSRLPEQSLLPAPRETAAAIPSAPPAPEPVAAEAPATPVPRATPVVPEALPPAWLPPAVPAPAPAAAPVASEPEAPSAAVVPAVPSVMPAVPEALPPAWLPPAVPAPAPAAAPVAGDPEAPTAAVVPPVPEALPPTVPETPPPPQASLPTPVAVAPSFVPPPPMFVDAPTLDPASPFGGYTASYAEPPPAAPIPPPLPLPVPAPATPVHAAPPVPATATPLPAPAPAPIPRYAAAVETPPPPPTAVTPPVSAATLEPPPADGGETAPPAVPSAVSAARVVEAPVATPVPVRVIAEADEDWTPAAPLTAAEAYAAALSDLRQRQPEAATAVDAWQQRFRTGATQGA